MKLFDRVLGPSGEGTVVGFPEGGLVEVRLDDGELWIFQEGVFTEPPHTIADDTDRPLFEVVEAAEKHAIILGHYGTEEE